MIELLIIFSDIVAEKLSQELLDLANKEIIDNVKLLDSIANESNTIIKDGKNFIDVIVLNDTSDAHNLTNEYYSNFVQQKLKELNSNLITVLIASEKLEEKSKPVINFNKNLNKFFTKIFSKQDLKFGKNIITTKIIPKPNLSELVKSSQTNTISNINEDIKVRSEIFTPIKPEESFDTVALEKDTKIIIEQSLNSLTVASRKQYVKWGYAKNENEEKKLLIFYGEPGTGKTLAAKAVANKLGKTIIEVSYALIESKWQGETQKNIEAAFYAAEKTDSLLFFDEAESFLSTRIKETSSSSDQAANAVRTTILTKLNSFNGIVICATNLGAQIDAAIANRMIKIEFRKPSMETRNKLWRIYLGIDEKSTKTISLADDVDTEYLAKKYDFVGRDIKDSVKLALDSVLFRNKDKVKIEDDDLILSFFDIVKQCEFTLSSRFTKESTKGKMPSDEQIKKMIQKYNKSKQNKLKDKFNFFKKTGNGNLKKD